MTRNYAVSALCALFIPVIISACGGGGGGGGSGGGSPTAVPRFAYAPNFGDGTLSIYTVNADTGRLRHNGYVVTGTQPMSSAVHPSGRFVYVANNGSDSISAYSINSGTGALTQILCVGGAAVCSGNSFTTYNGPQFIAIDPSGQFLYVASYLANTLAGYAINPVTGALTLITAAVTGNNPAKIALDPSGRFVYVANYGGGVSAYTVNTLTGVLARIDADTVTPGIQDYAAGTNPYSVTVDPSGRFVYVANFGSDDISAYRINTTTGVLTRMIASTGAPGIINLGSGGVGPDSITIESAGRFLYVANGDGMIAAYTVSSATGGLSFVGAVNAGSGAASVVTDPRGHYAYVSHLSADEVSVFTINQTTGALTGQTTFAGRDGNAGLAFATGSSAVAHVPKQLYAISPSATNITGFSVNAGSGALTVLPSSPYGAGFNAEGMALHPSGNFAYVALTNNNILRPYTVNTNSSWTPLIGNLTGTQPVAVAVDPAGRFVYVANYGGGVSAYSVNAGSGVLTAIGVGVVAAGTNPRAITVDRTGRRVLVANEGSSDVSAYTINTTTGALAQINCGGGAGCNGNNYSVGSGPFSVAVSASGRVAYVANSTGTTITTLAINSGTGALTSLGTVQTGFNPTSVAVDPTGRYIYTANLTANSISAYTVHPTLGTLTRIDADAATGGIQDFAVGAGSNPRSVAVDPSGQFLYSANFGTSNVSFFGINAATGALTSSLGTMTVGSGPVGLTMLETIQ